MRFLTEIEMAQLAAKISKTMPLKIEIYVQCGKAKKSVFEMNEQELAEVSELAFQKAKKEAEEAGLKMAVLPLEQTSYGKLR